MRAFVFRAAGRLFAAPLEQVAGICSRNEITRVPCAPPSILGLIHRRGRLVPVVTLLEQQEQRPEDHPEDPYESFDILVVESEGEQVALAVDALLGVMQAAPLEEARRADIDGLDESALLLDAGELIERHAALVAESCRNATSTQAKKERQGESHLEEA